jgi:hypothetical protein
MLSPLHAAKELMTYKKLRCCAIMEAQSHGLFYPDLNIMINNSQVHAEYFLKIYEYPTHILH